VNGDICDWCGEFLSNGYTIVEGFSEMWELCPSCNKEYEQNERDTQAEEELEEAQKAYTRIYGGCQDCGW
jgi:uncharacterized protein with PIN domain